MRRIIEPLTAEIDRRSFLKSCTIGAVAVAIPKFADAQTPAPPMNLRLAERQVLTAQDIVHKGMFKLPSSSLFSYSHGAMTARTVNGELRFFVSGRFEKDLIYEVSYPGYASHIDSAPTAKLLRTWGDIYLGRRYIKESGPQTWGIKWYQDRLYWTYTTPYEGTSWNQSLGVSTLNENSGTVTAYGPWRATVHSGQFNSHMMEIPDWFQAEHGVAPMAQLAGVRCQNAVSPWGASMLAFTPPEPSLPADSSASSSQRSIAVQKLSWSDRSNPQPREANFKICGWNKIYDCSQGATIRDAKPVFGGGGQLMDWMDTGVWIDTGSKHGVLMLGQLVDTIPGYPYPNGDTQTHAWYGPTVCCHGHDGRPMQAATGPGATTVVHTGWIYDPNDYVKVIRGQMQPLQVSPASTFQATAIPGNFVRNARRTVLKNYGGMHFDPKTRQLFLLRRNGWADGYDRPPVMHVFEIA